jgi:FkbM family methyltransferase
MWNEAHSAAPQLMAFKDHRGRPNPTKKKLKAKTMRILAKRLCRFFSKSSSVARICVRVRNGANRLVGYHLGESADPAENGEYRLLDLLAQHCKTFVDVGANVGEWSEYFLKRSPAKGILFEPSEQCASLLQKKFVGMPVTLHNVAVGEKAGVISFVEETNFGLTSSAIENRIFVLQGGTEKIVRVVSLDEMLLDTDFDIDFLKIDTEGYDLKVLKGAESLLKRGRIRFVQFEYILYWLSTGSSLSEAIRFLENVGFDLLLIRSTGLHAFDYSFWGDYFRYSNFLAYRQEDKHLLQSIVRQQI